MSKRRTRKYNQTCACCKAGEGSEYDMYDYKDVVPWNDSVPIRLMQTKTRYFDVDRQAIFTSVRVYE